ncbi:unnamed protein product [Protopolystoma xenopodis]|uniref:PDZ domain-containing protein n=1 Tax=Protopolystoma xenopodis TaxID=117903 RepID=A0A448XCS1_9PLAT|nr:unnamed protein product [Protopolystoma xenopodis]
MPTAFVQISAVNPGGPACLSGRVFPGDLLLGVDGISTIGVSHSKVVRLIGAEAANSPSNLSDDSTCAKLHETNTVSLSRPVGLQLKNPSSTAAAVLSSSYSSTSSPSISLPSSASLGQTNSPTKETICLLLRHRWFPSAQAKSAGEIGVHSEGEHNPQISGEFNLVDRNFPRYSDFM